MKIWQHDACKSMMSALGFGKPYEITGPDGKTRPVLGLRSLPRDAKKIIELPLDVANALRQRRFELEEELVTMEGSPSVAAAIRELKTHHSIEDVRLGVETALTMVKNILSQPRDIRMYRIKRGNPTFHRSLGRLSGSALLMNAIGFVAAGNSTQSGSGNQSIDENNSVYVLKTLQAEKAGAFDATKALQSSENQGVLTCLLSNYASRRLSNCIF